MSSSYGIYSVTLKTFLYVMKLKPNDFRKIVVGSFLAVPALSSLISTIHIITFFGLGNMPWMAIILALAFEIGSIASLMTLAVLDKVNRFAIWFIFFILVIMQMLGNVYYTYDFISQSMVSNPQWITSFIDLVEMMTMQKLDSRMSKFILSLLIGLPIPVISLAFLKSVSDYLKPEEKVEIVENIDKKEDNIEDAETEEVGELTNEEKVGEISKRPFIRVNNIILKPRVEHQPEIQPEIQEESSVESVIEINSDDLNEQVSEIQIEEKQEILETSESESVVEEVEEVGIFKNEAILEEYPSTDGIIEVPTESYENKDIYEDSEIVSTEERIIQDIIEENETEISETDSETEEDEKKLNPEPKFQLHPQIMNMTTI